MPRQLKPPGEVTVVWLAPGIWHYCRRTVVVGEYGTAYDRVLLDTIVIPDDNEIYVRYNRQDLPLAAIEDEIWDTLASLNLK